MFLRFRSGSSGLPIDTGQHRQFPRAQRLCVKCSLQFVYDEYHVIFECPALIPLRAHFSALFASTLPSMLRFMGQEDTQPVPVFVARCLQFMKSNA